MLDDDGLFFLFLFDWNKFTLLFDSPIRPLMLYFDLVCNWLSISFSYQLNEFSRFYFIFISCTAFRTIVVIFCVSLLILFVYIEHCWNRIGISTLWCLELMKLDGVTADSAGWWLFFYCCVIIFLLKCLIFTIFTVFALQLLCKSIADTPEVCLFFVL